MVELFRTIATGQGWHFSYGRRDFNNLEGEQGQMNYFFLDPIRETTNYQNGFKVSTDYEGRFMLLSPARLDQNYDAQRGQDKSVGKWLQNIKPKKSLIETHVRIPVSCEKDYEITAWAETEVINVMDLNGDGVLVAFKVRYTA